MFSDIKDDTKKHIINCIKNNKKIQDYLNYLRYELIICDNNLNNISLFETIIFYIDLIEIIKLKNNKIYNKVSYFEFKDVEIKYINYDSILFNKNINYDNIIIYNYNRFFIKNNIYEIICKIISKLFYNNKNEFNLVCQQYNKDIKINCDNLIEFTDSFLNLDYINNNFQKIDNSNNNNNNKINNIDNTKSILIYNHDKNNNEFIFYIYYNTIYDNINTNWNILYDNEENYKVNAYINKYEYTKIVKDENNKRKREFYEDDNIFAGIDNFFLSKNYNTKLNIINKKSKTLEEYNLRKVYEHEYYESKNRLNRLSNDINKYLKTHNKKLISQLKHPK